MLKFLSLMKMSHFFDNYVFTQENNEYFSAKDQCCPIECRDPLDNLDVVVVEPKVYRINCAVFAEPLDMDINSSFAISHEDSQDTNTFENVETSKIENVTIIKRKGKRKKYKMSIDQSTLICPQKLCKKSFLTTTLLKAHIRKVHCSDKDFVCEQCGASFNAQYLLNRHYVVHSKEKIQCPVCRKMLSRRTNLRLHLRSHADTRPHECTICHKRFLRRSTLNVHVSFVHKAVQKEQERSPDVTNPE